MVFLSLLSKINFESLQNLHQRDYVYCWNYFEVFENIHL